MVSQAARICAVALLFAACKGVIGGRPGAGAGIPGASASGGGGGAGGAPAPFEALPVAAAVAKVKTLLTGMAATQAEIDAVAAAPSALRSLVDDWMKLPA